MARRKNPVTSSGDKPVLEQELGITNLLPVGSWLTWNGSPTPDGTYSVGRDSSAPTQDQLTYFIRHDGQARAMLNILTLPIRAILANSKWVAPDKSGGADQEVEFANQMWSLPSNAGGMQVPLSMFLQQTLLSLAYGFSPFEIVKSYRTTGPLAGKFVIDKMAYRDPRTVTFFVDNNGNYMGFKQQTNFGGRAINVNIMKENSWYFAANEAENPLYGVSYFEPAFQHGEMKRKLYYIAHLAAQFAAIPGRIGEIPQGATPRQITEFKRSLSEFAFNTAMAVPPNFKVTPFDGRGGFNFIELIEHHDKMMTASILAKFLQQEDRQVLIDNGKADASADLFVQMLEAVVSELAESWSTKLMPQFIDYNFGTGVYPVFKFAPLTDDIKQAIFNLFTTIVGVQLPNATPEFVRSLEVELSERLGFDIDYKTIAQKEAQAAAEQQRQAAAQQQTQPQIAQPQGKTTGQPKTLQQPSRPPGIAASQLAERMADPEWVRRYNELVLTFSELINPEDVPDQFVPEGEVIPERDGLNGNL